MHARTGPHVNQTTREHTFPLNHARKYFAGDVLTILLQTDLDKLCMAMCELSVRSTLKNRDGLFKKPSNRRLHKPQSLCVEKTGSDGTALPCKQKAKEAARVIDVLARKRKSKKARARAKARAKANQASGGILTCNRGHYMVRIQLDK